MTEVVLVCAREGCGQRFIPTNCQLGARKRGGRLYCSLECQQEAARALMRKWWRSPKGLRYARDRRRKAKAEREGAAT